MTGGPFSEVDFDLLADFVGGALDGTPEEAELARLIDQDPAWADAYVTLTAGVDAVRLDLADWAAEPIAMPPLVTERLGSAISRAALASGGRPADPGAQDEPADPAAQDGPAALPTQHVRRPRRSAVPAQAGTASPQGSRGPGRRRQWVRRMAGPILVATVVAGFAGFAVSRLGLHSASDDAATSTALNSAADGAERAPALGSGPPRAVLEPSAERVLTTGTDYTASSLPDTVSTLAKRATERSRVSAAPDQATETPATMAGSAAPASSGTPQGVSGLERLADPSVLADCLDAVAVAHAQGPIAVELVDYASFAGRAALVVVFTDPSGARWAWATGPNCGTPTAGSDVTYQTRVG